LPAIGLALDLTTWALDTPAAHRKFSRMKFSSTALSVASVSPIDLARNAALWRRIHSESLDAESDAADPLVFAEEHAA
jgi:hypothetical protein